MRVARPLQFVAVKQATGKPSNAADDVNKEFDMNYTIDFAGVAGAIGLSVALALWLEWATLRGLMWLMPARAQEVEDVKEIDEVEEKAHAGRIVRASDRFPSKSLRPQFEVARGGSRP